MGYVVVLLADVSVNQVAHAEEPHATQEVQEPPTPAADTTPKPPATTEITEVGPALPAMRGNPVDSVEASNAFAGSVLIFDQSVLASDLCPSCQLSPSPLYEWWFSPRLYYTFAEHWRLGARFDLFQEVGTNHEETTNAHELVVGDPWLTAAYRTPIFNTHPHSRASITAIVRPPLSKESQANGQYFVGGARPPFRMATICARGRRSCARRGWKGASSTDTSSRGLSPPRPRRAPSMRGSSPMGRLPTTRSSAAARSRPTR